jgi:hypothetical protein
MDDARTDAWNGRVRVDLQNIKKMTASQLDRIKQYGSNAENLLQNRDFAQFVHHYKFDMMDQLAGITGHTLEDNNSRVAIGHNLAGIDGFIASLQRAKWYKDKVVSLQNQPAPTVTEEKEVYGRNS